MNYLNALQSNLRHLSALLPAAPRRNLANSTPKISNTEADSYLQHQIHWQTIPEGRAGTHSTVALMAELARQAAAAPAFRKFAQQFPSLDALDQWARDHFVYRDEDEEIVRTPLFMLQDMGRVVADRVVGLEGDCDDIATFLAATTKVLNYPTRLTAIRYHQSNPDFEHVFAEAYDGQQWVTLDPTVEGGSEIHAIEDLTQTV